MTHLPAGILVAHCPNHAEVLWGRWEWMSDGTLCTRPASNDSRRTVQTSEDGARVTRVQRVGLPELHAQAPENLANRADAGPEWTKVLRCSRRTCPARLRYRDETLFDVVEMLHGIGYLAPGATGELLTNLDTCFRLASDTDALARFRDLPAGTGRAVLAS